MKCVSIALSDYTTASITAIGNESFSPAKSANALVLTNGKYWLQEDSLGNKNICTQTSSPSINATVGLSTVTSVNFVGGRPNDR